MVFKLISPNLAPPPPPPPPRKQPSCCYVCKGLKVLQTSSCRHQMSNDTATSTIGATDNAVYFTQWQFAAGLCLPIPSLVKQFLHFTRAPPTLIHPNVFRIMMGCSVLNSLYQLDILLEDLFYLHFEAWDWGLRIYFSLQPSVAICNWSFGLP